MKTLQVAILSLVALGACAAPPAKPPTPPSSGEALPQLAPEMRIVSLPVTDDLEDLATYSRLGLPLDVYASISAGEEPVVARVVSKAALITITRGADSRASSVMLAVPKEDVELLVLTRELARRRQASFYLSAVPRNAPAEAGNSRDQGLRLRQVMTRLGYEIPVKKPEPEAPKAAPAPAQAPAAPPPEAQAGAVNLPPLPPRLAPARILIDGSSTVFIMAKLVRDEFMRRYPGVSIELMGVGPGESPSGTGGGFKKFCYGETDISDASRLIKDDEIRKCAGNDVSFVELPLAYDGISLVVNRENTWTKHLTVPEIKAIWAQDSKVATWHDVRPEFPAQPIKLFSPGRDSGTFDFFLEEICGKGASLRPDVVSSEDDEVLVRGIIGSPGGLGYFGLAYYIEHKDALRLIGIDSGKGPVFPTNDTILDGSYSPLSRPLFLYVNSRSLRRPEVGAFVTYFLRESQRAAQAVGYIPLPEDIRRLSAERFARNVEGSMRPVGQSPGTLRAMMVRQ